jgi:tetratricopeptide (TPR) repeat protein
MNRLSIILLLLLLIQACASTKEKRHETPLDLFNRILEISTSSEDRQAVLPEIEALYKRIITEYPDAPLTQESYWRLIKIYLEEYSPPALKKAEELYKEFSMRYPDSIFRNMVIETMSRGYYNAGRWKELLEISLPIFDRYVKDGIRPGPLILLMYSEANFRLGHAEEAKKGYEIAIKLYPALKNNREVKERLDELNREEFD